MNYVTTNIRIAEQDYLSLKMEAAKTRKSLSQLIREKLQYTPQTPSGAIDAFFALRKRLPKKTRKTILRAIAEGRA